MPSIIKEENKRRDKSIKEDKDMKKNSKRRMFSALLILFLMIQMTVQADTGTKERVDLASRTPEAAWKSWNVRERNSSRSLIP